MRVISGEAKGCILRAAPGLSTRPVTGLVRGALFSILETMDVGWGRVLDLFAGSGAIGIEALSRGARWVDFVEQSRRSCDIIRGNLERTGFKERAHVYQCSVERAISFLDQSYDIIFLDPPYASTIIGEVMEQIAGSQLVNGDTQVVLSHAARRNMSDTYGGLTRTRECRYGDSVIAFYRLGERY